MVLVMARQGALIAVRRWPKTLKTKLNFKWDYQAQVYSGQMVLMVVWQGGWTILTVAKDAQGNNPRKPRGLLKTGIVTAYKKVNLLFLRGC
jgi:hypothetical protein